MLESNDDTMGYGASVDCEVTGEVVSGNNETYYNLKQGWQISSTRAKVDTHEIFDGTRKTFICPYIFIDF